MNEELRQAIKAKLEADHLGNSTMAVALFAAFDGRDALESALTTGPDAAQSTNEPVKSKAEAAYINSVTVEGFRGIGPKQVLQFQPGPGLTLVIGRNGSGKSSFAEALEVLLTGDNRRWSDRPKVWQEGWRNLHRPAPTTVSAEFLLARGGPTRVERRWDESDDLDNAQTVVQPKGKPQLAFEELGWEEALVSFRPFLSYNELSSWLDEGPSRLYDALALVLGLEDLVEAQGVLAKARTDRQRAFKEADQERKELIAALEQVQEHSDDERVIAALKALKSANWGLEAIEKVLADRTADDDTPLNALQAGSVLSFPDESQVRDIVRSLREAETAMARVAGSDADRSRELATLLSAALEFHDHHQDNDCPVCGAREALDPKWKQRSQEQVKQLRLLAKESENVHHQAEKVRRSALALLGAPVPKVLASLARVGVEGAGSAQELWSRWLEGSRLHAPSQLADFMDKHYPAFAAAVTRVRESAAREYEKRQDRWRPLGAALAAWHAAASSARTGKDDLEIVKEAEEWLKTAAGDIRDQRFAPIAENAMQNWRLLRQNSNVELGRINLAGSGNKRSVSLDVTVDGVAGAALGVMSQGELNALALSLFLPRATMSESPFRFVVIDDPVQSMDPSRVDGLAKVLERVSHERQVIVFTHDDRLPEAVRRLDIKATHIAVTRRPASVVEVRTALDPVAAAVEDALALVHTAELPRDVLQRVVPGYCRAAIEAACVRVIRRRRLSQGDAHADVETTLEGARTLSTLAALALYDDPARGGDVMPRLNRIGGWAGDAFVGARDGAHGGFAGDLTTLVRNTENLCAKILELR